MPESWCGDDDQAHESRAAINVGQACIYVAEMCPSIHFAINLLQRLFLSCNFM
jgi:hypothetical protein